MNYLDRPLLAQLAQRYVTGVMPYLARRRFQQLMREHEQIEETVLAWEEYFISLALAHNPVKPSMLVWQRITRQLDKAPNPVRVSTKRDLQPLLAGLSVFMFVGLIVTSSAWWNEANQPPEVVVERVVEKEIQLVDKLVPEEAIISVMGQAEPPVWIVKIYPNTQKLIVAVNALPEAQPDKDYELWALKDDKIPVSLGVLPKDGKLSIELDEIKLASIARSTTLAVSLEPLGGSPQSTPTGPVLYTALLLSN